MTIRPATTADASAIAAIHVETWRAAYRGQIPDAILEALDVERSASLWRERVTRAVDSVFVAEDKETVVGFCNLVPSRDKDADPRNIAEIAAIYVHPQHWRKRAGRALCDCALGEAGRRGYQAVTLWVLDSNDSAKRFYESVGFHPDGAVKTDEIKLGTAVHEVRFRRALELGQKEEKSFLQHRVK